MYIQSLVETMCREDTFRLNLQSHEATGTTDSPLGIR